MKTILGLDISTRCTGLCVLNDTLNCSYVRSDKEGLSIFDKASLVRQELRRIKDAYGVTNIYIEQSVTRMGRGSSSAHTINLLSRFNGIVSWIVYDTFGMEPTFFDVRTARKELGINIARGQDPKEMVMRHLIQNHKFSPEYSPAGKIYSWWYDMADAYVMALYGKKLYGI